MNYKELVDRIRQVVFDHKMLVDFGYGQISDIKVRSEGEGEESGADYPYCFLNPQPHVRTETEITYNFNMIVMDMAREEEGDEYQNFLAIQSDCIQYIDDIIARLYYHYTDQPQVSFNLSYTPFYERFQDDLAGATANLAITVPTNINDCITPFKPDVPVLEPLTNAFRFSVNGGADIYFNKNFVPNQQDSAQIVRDNYDSTCTFPPTTFLGGVTLKKEVGEPVVVGSQIYQDNGDPATFLQAGYDYLIIWEVPNDFCNDFTTGVYQLTFDSGGKVLTKQLVNNV